MGGLGHKRARARSYQKATVHRRSESRFLKLKRSIRDPILKEKWDDRKSLAKNISAINMMDYFERLPKAEDIVTGHPPRLSEDEDKWIAALYKRYGDDVEKYSRDRRLNPMQWTVTQCQKRLDTYKQKTAVPTPLSHVEENSE